MSKFSFQQELEFGETENRNGYAVLAAVNINVLDNVTSITCVSRSKQKVLRGGIWMDNGAFKQLALKYLKETRLFALVSDAGNSVQIFGSYPEAKAASEKLLSGHGTKATVVEVK